MSTHGMDVAITVETPVSSTNECTPQHRQLQCTWSGHAKKHGQHREREAHALDRQHALPPGKAPSTGYLQILKYSNASPPEAHV